MVVLLCIDFFPTSIKKEIESGRIKYDDLIKKSLQIDSKCWCLITFYLTSFVKIIDCGPSFYGNKVIILLLTSKFDFDYCSLAK